MADTPDLGAAEENFKTTEATFKETESAYLAAQEAFKADETNEELKTAFTEHETKYNEIKSTYETARSALDELKASSKKGYWPEDWREKYIDGQVDKDGKPLDEAGKEKLLKRLSRYASPQAALDAMINAQNKISAGGMIKIPGKDATPEEIAQYRKEIGVPDEPKGYDLTLGDGRVLGDEDTDKVHSFLEAAHASNYTPEQVKASLEWYHTLKEEAAAAEYERDLKYKSDSEEELRQEWGAEYKSNQNLMANYLSSDFGEEIAKSIIYARLPDGNLLGNNPDVVRGFVAKARAANPIGALMPGSGTKQYDSMMAEIEKLESEMGTDAWYKDTKKQERYKKLISVRDNMR